MSSYNELVKNFEKIRNYMREFYVYGFKSRNEFQRKSARSYDDERRRIESWLGEYMSFVHTGEGKNVFISIDSRVSTHNPFYKALKARSFTDGDITLHFIIFDILHSPEVVLSLPEILEKIDNYLSDFEHPMTFDDSTVRKKLKEYIAQGIIASQKEGKKLLYHRAEDIALPDLTDVLNFFSEVAPCGVMGAFLLDKQDDKSSYFTFKHHYITSAIDSDVTATLFKAMSEKSVISADNLSRREQISKKVRIIPLQILISVQNGRQHLIAYQPDLNTIKAFRIDYLSNIKIEEPTPRFDELRAEFNNMKTKMWGVSTSRRRYNPDQTEHVDFTVKINDKEDYIIRRLEREKRVGRIEKLNDNTYRFTADIYDTNEIIPWIRTFICRITHINFSNKTIERQFRNDLNEMYRIYGIKEVEI